MSELKLLNCPFCNGKAEFVKMGIAKDIPLGFVRCTECGIRLRQENCTEDFARDEWNRRKPMANIVEKLEERRIEYELSSIKAPDEISTVYRKGVMRGYEYSRDLVKQEINNGN